MAVKLGNGQWAVKENNLLAYNDNSGQFFNKEFDFTRGSSATYVGKDGLIKTAGLQDTNLVQNGDFSQLGSELVANGDFSDGLSSWSVVGGSYASVDNGILNSNNTSSGSWHSQYIGQELSFINGKTYKIELKARNVSGNLNLRLTQQAFIIFNQNITSEFVNYIFYYTAQHDGYQLRLFCNDNVGQFEIDNVSVKQVDPNDEWSLGSGWSISGGKATKSGSDLAYLTQSSLNSVVGKTYKVKASITNVTTGNVRIDNFTSGTSFTSDTEVNITYKATSVGAFRFLGWNGFDGSIDNISVQEVQVNTPRIDFSDSVDGALLLEPQSTNLITYSSDFSQSSWASFNGTIVVPNQITSPDGSSLADRIECGINGNLTPIFDYINITNGEYYTFSVFAKKGEIDKFIISGQENLLTNVSFNLTTGTIISTSGSGYVDSTIEEFSNGWYRCSVTALANGTRLGRFILYAGISGNEPNLGDGIYYFGAQQEQKSFATSYISTQGATSTRIAETCTNSGSAQDFNDSEGVLFADISGFNLPAGYISISDGTYGNSIRIGFVSDTLIKVWVYVGNSSVISQLFTYDTSNMNKIAVKYSLTDFKVYINGSNVFSTSSVTFPIGTLSKLAFRRGDQYSPFFGKTKDLKYYPKALTDSELEYITSFRSLNELVTTLKLNKL